MEKEKVSSPKEIITLAGYYISMVESSKQNQNFSARKDISLVFIGETGAGKTTLLTAFKDFGNGKKFKDRSKTKIAHKEQRRGVS